MEYRLLHRCTIHHSTQSVRLQQGITRPGPCRSVRTYFGALLDDAHAQLLALVLAKLQAHTRHSNHQVTT